VELNEILLEALTQGASDVHIKIGQPAIIRIDGSLKPLKGAKPYNYNEVNQMALGIMNEWQKERFLREKEVDMGYEIHGLGRFRVNIFQQRGKIRIALRIVPYQIKNLKELNLPDVIEKVAMENRGLILVTGTTGSGRTCHIITVEDPIEFVHDDKKAIVDQREVGSDTGTFANALRSSLRQDPDVILVGEMRDFETIETALTAAETGHLVMSTLHTIDAKETVTRIISTFPPYHQRQVRMQLAGVIKGVVSQRLVPKADGVGRVPAVEILVSTARVRECIIEKEKTAELQDAVAKGYTSYGMQTFDQSLMSLLKGKLISYDEALRQSTNPDDFALRVKGILATGDTPWDDFEKVHKGEEEKESEQGRRVPPERF
jgi:twitching motility protein PilT